MHHLEKKMSGRAEEIANTQLRVERKYKCFPPHFHYLYFLIFLLKLYYLYNPLNFINEKRVN